MSAVTNLNEFPLHEISSSMSTIKLCLLILGLIKFSLVQLLLHRKRISLFFRSSEPCDHHDEHSTKKAAAAAADDDDDESTCGGEDVQMVMTRLGLFGQEKVPAKMSADEIFQIFEEREPSLGEVREAFEVFDGNRDGFIDEKELQKVLCALGLKEGMEMENCRRMIEAVDQDGDGRIGFHEFVKFMENTFT